MYLGDNLVKEGITPFVREFEQMRPNAQILLAHVPNPQDFGVAVLDGERVVRLMEKPRHPPTDLALVGVYMFDHHIFEAVNAIQPSARGELEITDAIQYLIDHGYQVRSHIISGWWKDTGNLDAILEANRILLEDIERDVRAEVDTRSRLHGRVCLGEGTRVINSVIRGPVIIGTHCLIENAYIGPFTSIADGVQVVSSEVEHSVILEGCRILNIGSRMEDSLLGRNVTVCRDEGKPRAVRLMLGDNSQVNLL
jgi:glucose-1-phosphate thymidylyltransferase